MVLPTWPAGVPIIPRLEEFQPVQRLREPLATEMEGGNVRMRSRPGDNVGTMPLRLRMTLAQFTTFTAWWKATLNNATARFTATVFLGTGCQTKVCQFTREGIPQDQYVDSDTIDVAMTLRIYNI
jgi:hypothetical protein